MLYVVLENLGFAFLVTFAMLGLTGLIYLLPSLWHILPVMALALFLGLFVHGKVMDLIGYVKHSRSPKKQETSVSVATVQ